MHLHAIVNNLVDELRLCTWDMFVRVHVEPASSRKLSLPKSAVAWHEHIDDLFVDSLWRELCVQTTVFAGVINVTQRTTRLPF